VRLTPSYYRYRCWWSKDPHQQIGSYYQSHSIKRSKKTKENGGSNDHPNVKDWCVSNFYRAMHVVLERYCYRKSSVRCWLASYSDPHSQSTCLSVVSVAVGHSVCLSVCIFNKKAQLSLTNPRDACEMFARFT